MQKYIGFKIFYNALVSLQLKKTQIEANPQYSKINVN